MNKIKQIIQEVTQWQLKDIRILCDAYTTLEDEVVQLNQEVATLKTKLAETEESRITWMQTAQALQHVHDEQNSKKETTDDAIGYPDEPSKERKGKGRNSTVRE